MRGRLARQEGAGPSGHVAALHGAGHLDCLKQAIDQKVVGPQRKDFIKNCMREEQGALASVSLLRCPSIAGRHWREPGS